MDEITMTIVPHVMEGGDRLFADLTKKLKFKCVDTKKYVEEVVQHHFVLKRNSPSEK